MFYQNLLKSNNIVKYLKYLTIFNNAEKNDNFLKNNYANIQKLRIDIYQKYYLFILYIQSNIIDGNLIIYFTEYFI